ncbi:hypothetical protein [Treponema primitia]|nr:hypothetical protein [Treponema primitia]
MNEEQVLRAYSLFETIPMRTVLNTALKEEVFITRKDGSKFKIISVNKKDKNSPLDIEGINTDISTK